MSNFIDMTGWVMKDHGVSDSLITIIRQMQDYISPQGKHTTQWLCQCECGSEPFITTGQKLRNGHTKSCGCKRKNYEDKVRVKRDLTKQTFGRLMVIEQAEDYIAPSDKKTLRSMALLVRMWKFNNCQNNRFNTKHNKKLRMFVVGGNGTKKQRYLQGI